MPTESGSIAHFSGSCQRAIADFRCEAPSQHRWLDWCSWGELGHRLEIDRGFGDDHLQARLQSAQPLPNLFQRQLRSPLCHCSGRGRGRVQKRRPALCLASSAAGAAVSTGAASACSPQPGRCKIHELQSQDEEHPQQGDDSQGLECLGRHDQESPRAPQMPAISPDSTQRLRQPGEMDGSPFKEDADPRRWRRRQSPSHLLRSQGLHSIPRGMK